MKRGVTVLRRLEEERLGQLSSVSRLFLGIMMTNRYDDYDNSDVDDDDDNNDHESDDDSDDDDNDDKQV